MSANPTCVLQLGRLHPTVEQGLASGFNTVKVPAPAADALPLDEATAARVEAVVTSAAMGLPAAWLAALPRLRVVSSFGVGTDRLPLEACQARGINVGYTPDVLNDCVADTAMAGLLAAARQVCAADRFVREGRWLNGPFALTTQVSGHARGNHPGVGRQQPEVGVQRAGAVVVIMLEHVIAGVGMRMFAVLVLIVVMLMRRLAFAKMAQGHAGQVLHCHAGQLTAAQHTG